MSRFLDHVRLHEREYWDLLETLVGIESPSSHKAGVDHVGDVLADRWAALGFSERRVPEEEFGDQRIFDRIGAPGLPHLLLVGHLDTVYALGSAWPFRRGADGRAYGPGVIDMKSGLVAMLGAVAALDHVMSPDTVPTIRVLLNSDEEPGSPRSRRVFPDVAEGIHAAFVLEPAEPSGRLVLERKGVGIFRFEFTGRSAHAGQEPELGIDANEALARILLEAKALADPAVGTTVNPGVIAGGTVPYAISADATLHVDVRVATQTELARVAAALEELSRREPVAGIEIDLSGGFHRPPMIGLPGARQMLSCYLAAAEECGFAPDGGVSGAASDANDLTFLGIPTLDGLGPVGGRAHSSEEYMESETFAPRIGALAGAVSRLSAVAPEDLREAKEPEND